MKKTVISTISLIAMLAIAQVPAFAKDVAKGEIFGGYSLISSDIDGNAARDTLNGWAAAYEFGVHKNIGIVADFGGHYKSFTGVRVNLLETNFGPLYNYQMDKATMFGHALFGNAHASGPAVTPSQNFFTMAYGGGVDVNATKSLDIRVIQADWLILRDASGATPVWNKDGVRLSFGVVFKAGKK